MKTLTAENNALVYRFGGELLRIEPWGNNSFRVRSSIMHEAEDTRYALLEPPVCNAEIRIEEYQGEIVNGKIRAVLYINEGNYGGTLQFLNQEGKVLLQETGDGGALKRSSRKFEPLQGGNFRLKVRFASEPKEKLYGMGQYQQEILDLKNCSLELAQRNTQASVPFVVSNLGYGFLWHNPAVGQVVFGKNLTEWCAESTRQMDYWITAGDSPDEIERSYADITGKVPMMPEYGMGFWQCKLRYWNQEQLLKVAREYKRRGVPVDVIVCDFYHWPKTGDFRFDKDFFPDPKAMVDELERMGMKLMVSVWPQVAVESENYGEMRQKGYLIKSEKGMEFTTEMFGSFGSIYDATNPEAGKYVWEKCRKNYYDNGIRMFWLDEAEPDYSVYDYSQYRYYAGQALEITNIYPAMFSKNFYDGMVDAGQEKIVNLVRCAWAGSQRYGALVWSGDIHCNWESLRKQLCAGLNIGMAGIPWWTTDIGGFSGGDPSENSFRQLMIRWFEWGTFCPVMRLHGDRLPDYEPETNNGRKILFTGSDNEIWSFGEENYPLLKRYVLFREVMRPYTRLLMEEAHCLGRPVMRTMFYEFPEDPECWELQDQYMYGPDVLVAPVIYENAVCRTVYLPEGIMWTDIHNGSIHEGGRYVSCDAPLDQIPVFLRENTHSDWIGLI